MFNDEDSIVHRLCPRDSAVASQFMHKFKTEHSEDEIRRAFMDIHGDVVVRSDCNARIERGTIGTETITCIACIASPMEPT